jgi:GntR family transcriptional regulator, arabinose operon transcriptional repressor
LRGALAKYKDIFESLKQSIDEGIYSAGLRLPSENDMVRTYRASRVTVVRALKELQINGYAERRAGSGTYVKSYSSKQYTFGLLIPQLGQTEIFEPICQGMVAAQQIKNHVLVWGKTLTGADATEADARDICLRLISNRPSGVFFAPFESSVCQDEINHTVTSMLDEAGIPTVLLDRDVVAYPSRSRYDVVGIDNRRAGRVVTQHLVKTGCKRIGFIGKPHLAPSCIARAAGYREAIAAAHVDRDAEFCETFDPLDYAYLLAVMKKHKPDGIVCSNDHTAAQIMKSFTKLKIAVPEMVRLAGFDDVKYASLVSVPLTTIHQPCAQIGAAAVQAMIQRIESPQMPSRDIFVDFKLVVRQSCGTNSDAQ